MYATYLFMILGLMAAPEGAPATCDPALAALFAPPQPAIGHYEVCTTTERLEAVVSERRSDGAPFIVSEAEALNALDAFGTGGRYRRAKLARLYSGLALCRSHARADHRNRELASRARHRSDSNLERLCNAGVCHI